METIIKKIFYEDDQKLFTWRDALEQLCVAWENAENVEIQSKMIDEFEEHLNCGRSIEGCRNCDPQDGWLASSEFFNASEPSEVKESESVINKQEFIKLNVGDEIELLNEKGELEKVTVIELIPHDCVLHSFYYKFSNGQVCRDIRLHYQN